ncbi:hypothetical protein LTR62_007832 [Meristemomyces frigidus]|uniref:Chromo domain-containing protein n=1 Tax=Meristemomyces frigidus TaxID=1508187 RepID=A0AAN7YNM8_9PEZI|nr:hypothetical protein LTR62_007832 [Meristemomyces frigidus]
MAVGRVAHVSIPVQTSSQHRVSTTSSRQPWQGSVETKTYENGPLPIKLSDNAPADARIVGRVLGDNGAYYDINIGGVTINNVGISEILDYVSAQHLEDYENQQFCEEEEVRLVEEAEHARVGAERVKRRKERAKMKGIAGYVLPGESSGQEVEVAIGKHGRARPNYSPFYQLPEKRSRRRRDPITGDLLPLNDQVVQPRTLAIGSSQDEEEGLSTHGQLLKDQLKRRRRKRDPKTGELLPLDPLPGEDVGESKKRRRRRRHPITNELMPYSWKYDPATEGDTKAPDILRTDVGAMAPGMHRLSIGLDHQTKRVKLDSQSSSGRSVSAQVVLPNPVRYADRDESSGSGDEVALAPVSQRAASYGMLANSRALSAQHTLRKQVPASTHGMLVNASMFQHRTTGISADETSSEQNPRKETSLMQAMYDGQNSNESDHEMGEGEWNIEGILAHHMSDPRTHPTELGKKPVMLYQVQWEGADELTWEPAESFSEQSIIEDYRMRVERHESIKAAGSKASTTSHLNTTQRTAPFAPDKQVTSSGPSLAKLLATAQQQPRLTEVKDSSDENQSSDDEEDDDGAYEVEDILAHHLSDPRTHEPEFGKQPIMLYEVKWRGYDGSTWEPFASFEDVSVVKRYRQKVGLESVSR